MHMTDTHADRSNEAPLRAMHGHTCSADVPFARLSIGPANYEIADALNEEDMLAFRSEGHTIWTAIDRRISDGWNRIGADILLADPDSVYEFLRTHAVRVAKVLEPQVEQSFDTLGTPWQVRFISSFSAEISFDGGEWEMVNLGARASVDHRERAILTLIKSSVDVKTIFSQSVENWASRIATGCSIAPLMPA